MRDYLSSEVRNVSVIGHSGAGKTSVLEAMLYYTKATDRFGKTSDGSSMIDFDAEEINVAFLSIHPSFRSNGKTVRSISSIHRGIWTLSVKNKLVLR